MLVFMRSDVTWSRNKNIEIPRGYVYLLCNLVLFIFNIRTSFLARKNTIGIYQIILSLVIEAEKEYIKLQRESRVSNPQI